MNPARPAGEAAVSLTRLPATAVPGPRTVRSLLLVTGEGLRGPRERALRRRLASLGGPIEIRRYGVLRSGSLLKWCQQIAVNRLAGRIRALAEASGPPDILAHSFGAWLVGHALRSHPDLRVGRVIAIGSVLRPDFDWAALVARGQAEAVLNQYGRRDRWVWATEFFIPGSGPAGLRGCPVQSGLINHVHPTFGHTTFFDDTVIDEVDRDVWRPFLTQAIPDLAQLANANEVGPWRPAPWLVRATVPRLFVLLAIGAGAVGIVAGVVALARALW
jgi:hypothetical protein